MPPLRMPCANRKSSSARASTSTMALPMPRTSNRAEFGIAIESLRLSRVAHYSGRLLHGKLTNGMGTPANSIGAIKPDRRRADEVSTDEVQRADFLRRAADRQSSSRQLSGRH